MLKEHLKLLICPDCKGNLNKIEIRKTIAGVYCEKCQIIYPVRDDIPIILAKEARNYDLEYPLLDKIAKELLNNSSDELHQLIKRTLDLLKSKKGILTWEWEDEKYWSKAYSRTLESMRNVQEKRLRIKTHDTFLEPARSRARVMQRARVVKELTDRLNLQNKTVLSVGEGGGRNFRRLLLKYCNENTLYIAIDLSFEALVLNRSLNKHRNSLYVLCSADYELPFSDNMVDVLIYFGILHHTKNKSDNICKDKRLVKRNGFIIINESLKRPTLGYINCLMQKEEASAHEDCISKMNLFAQLNSKKGIEVVFVREEGTLFFTAMITLFSNTMLGNRKIFLLILNSDILIAKTFGRIIPFFGAGEILLLAKRSTEWPEVKHTYSESESS